MMRLACCSLLLLTACATRFLDEPTSDDAFVEVDMAGGIQCGGGTIACGGRCLDPSSDNNNCGACGNVCPPSSMCVTGACVSATQNGQCDLIAQTGCTAMAPKCTELDNGQGPPQPSCVEVTGQGRAGAACSRAGTGQTSTGRDDCAPGYFCSGYGTLNSANPERHCRRYCAQDSACAQSERCMQFDPMLGVGICVPICDPFTTGACAPPFVCGETINGNDQNGTIYFSCRTAGLTKVGGNCQDDASCIAGALCDFTRGNGQQGMCRLVCNAANPCPGGAACMQISFMGMAIPLPDGAGLCQ